jgi:hypothetical protein
MNRYIAIIVFTVIPLTAMAETASVADFEDLGLPPDSVRNDVPFTTSGMQFNNSFTDFGSFSVWAGFAQSSKTDSATPGFGNQYSAITGSGAGGSSTYGVAFTGGDIVPAITLPPGASPVSLDITNTAYAYYSMRDGDAFAKKFGGATGTDPDFFLLTITGRDAGGASIGQVDFYLANVLASDGTQDYLVNSWTTVDVSTLIGARSLTFGLTSSDNHPTFGMNTPAYFAIDNVTFVPEPAAIGVLGMLACTLVARAPRPCARRLSGSPNMGGAPMPRFD